MHSNPPLGTASATELQLSHAGGEWRLERVPHWPGRDLRDLLLLRSEAELPALHLLQARRLDAPQEAYWLFTPKPLSTAQQARCAARGWLALSPADCPPALATHLAASAPTTLRQQASGPSLQTLLGAAVLVGLVLGGGLFWQLQREREQRIQEQNLRAAQVVMALQRGDQALRGPVEQLHAGLIGLGIAWHDGERVHSRPAADPAALLDSLLTPALRREVGDLDGLQRYLAAQAARLGRPRLVMGTEHCSYAGVPVIPLSGKRAFVLHLQPQDMWGQELRWAGVEQIDPRQLEGCQALPLQSMAAGAQDNRG